MPAPPPIQPFEHRLAVFCAGIFEFIAFTSLVRFTFVYWPRMTGFGPSTSGSLIGDVVTQSPVLLLEALFVYQPFTGNTLCRKLAENCIRTFTSPAIPSSDQHPTTNTRMRVQERGSLQIVQPGVILGHGSGGTIVLKGSFQGRDVAVKRIVSDFATLVERELDILRRSDSHPNIIRYFYHTTDDHFQYIALELCPASLEDIINVERRHLDQFRDLVVAFEPKRALREITAGLHHLHALRLVHRDIKPQNILVSDVAQGQLRMLISDFGLCKQLELGRMSHNPSTPEPAGTVGWRAPEVLRGEVKLDAGDGAAGSSAAAAASAWSFRTRQTQSVDIFALGCLYHYVLTRGDHPFGAGVQREFNILNNVRDLERLEDMVAVDAIERMLSPRAEDSFWQPDATACLLHPCLWDADKVLMFFQEASDRFQTNSPESLENGSEDVVGGDWRESLDPAFIAHFNKKRKYNGKSVRDLLRLVRNAKHHYHELPDSVQMQLGTTSEDFLKYFTFKFPKLFLRVYNVVSSSPLRAESTFRSFFDLN